MRRRAFIGGLAGTVAWPLVARARNFDHRHAGGGLGGRTTVSPSLINSPAQQNPGRNI